MTSCTLFGRSILALLRQRVLHVVRQARRRRQRGGRLTGAGRAGRRCGCDQYDPFFSLTFFIRLSSYYLVHSNFILNFIVSFSSSERLTSSTTSYLDHSWRTSFGEGLRILSNDGRQHVCVLLKECCRSYTAKSSRQIRFRGFDLGENGICELLLNSVNTCVASAGPL